MEDSLRCLNISLARPTATWSIYGRRADALDGTSGFLRREQWFGCVDIAHLKLHACTLQGLEREIRPYLESWGYTLIPLSPVAILSLLQSFFFSTLTYMSRGRSEVVRSVVSLLWHKTDSRDCILFRQTGDSLNRLLQRTNNDLCHVSARGTAGWSNCRDSSATSIVRSYAPLCCDCRFTRTGNGSSYFKGPATVPGHSVNAPLLLS